MEDCIIKEMEGYAQNIVEPVMVEYTKWVISECRQRNIDKVYFLARDGYLLHLIAKKICEVNGINMDIRYLYCSRYSLRIPTFNLIDSEKYDVLFLKSCRCTLSTVLKRAGLNDEQCEELSRSLSVDQSKILDNKEFKSIKEQLINNPKFNKILEENSASAYKNIVDYFSQEGLFDGDIVLVDSGWTGSMQRSIRQIADSVNFKGKITGFYFGMYKAPKPEDGEYLTYYFSAKTGKKRKINFNNNVFECMLSANHGMTIGYERLNGSMVPILQTIKNDNMYTLVQTQIDSVMKDIDSQKGKLNIDNFDTKKSIKYIYPILKKVIIYPTIKQVEMLSNIYFCDDITGSYQIPLVDKNSTKLMKDNMILPQIGRMIFGKKYALDKVYWPYGVIAYQPKILRPWYRSNYKFMYFIRYTFFK